VQVHKSTTAHFWLLDFLIQDDNKMTLIYDKLFLVKQRRSMVKPNQKNMLKIIGINLVLFALLYGLVSLNKEILRPKYSHSSFISILTGSFPNFIAAYIISLAFVNAVLIRKPQNGRLIIYIGSVLVFTILAIEEILPMWGASTYYDPLDILASGLGSILSITTFELIVRNAR